MKKRNRILAAMVLSFGCAGVAQAIPLSDLLNGGSITVEDKLFNNWDVLYSDRSDGNMVNTGNIDVTGLLGGVGPGLQFDILNNEFTVEGDDIYAYIDFQFSFQVTVLDPSKTIVGNALELQGGLAHTNDGFNDLGIFIDESIGTAALLNDIAGNYVDFNVLDDAVSGDPTNSVLFPQHTSLWVTKNIAVWSTDVGDTANLSSFSQRFIQGTRPSQIPEPMSLALIGIGLIGMAATRRKGQPASAKV